MGSWPKQILRGTILDRERQTCFSRVVLEFGSLGALSRRRSSKECYRLLPNDSTYNAILQQQI
eukprot:scaffold238944_cov33-Tisochrysis_lutea.AAC.4